MAGRPQLIRRRALARSGDRTREFAIGRGHGGSASQGVPGTETGWTFLTRTSASLSRLVLDRFAALLDVLAYARHGVATCKRPKETNQEECRQ